MEAIPFQESGISTSILYPVDNKTKIFTLFGSSGAMHKVLILATLQGYSGCSHGGNGCRKLLSDVERSEFWRLNRMCRRERMKKKVFFYLDRSGNGRDLSRGRGCRLGSERGTSRIAE